ncbi:hypothetical protein Tco_0982376 [Tanacetum coccineum]
MKKTRILTKGYCVTPTTMLGHHGFIGYPFDYRVTLGFGSITGGLDPVNPIIRLPIERGIDSGTREAGYTTDGESVTSEHKTLEPAHTDDVRSLEEELCSEEDLDEWLKGEMEKNVSKQDEKNKEDALIAIIKSIREECRGYHKNKQNNALEADLKSSSKTSKDTITNDSPTSNLSCQPPLEELNPRSFLLPFTINNYNSYDMANIDGSNNVMPRSIYEYLKLDNLGGTTIETLGTMNNIWLRIDKFEFPCYFVITDMPENLREMIIFGRPFLETVHAQIDVAYDDGNGEDCRMWPTCDPNSSFCYGYKEVFRKTKQGLLRQWVCFRDHERRTVKGSCMGFVDLLQVRYGNQGIDDTTREWRYYEWVAQNYEFNKNRTPSTTTMSNKYLYKINHQTSTPLDAWDTRGHSAYKGSTSNQDMLNNDPVQFSPEHLELGEQADIRPN